MSGSKIRSRVELLDNKEQPSTFFYRKELSHGKKKLITKIITEDDNICKDNASISQSFVQFYTKLYSKEPVVKPPNGYIDNLPKVEEDAASGMGDPIENEEIQLAIGRMESNKTPGPDGLTKEFYDAFSKELIPILKDIFGAIFEQGSLSKSQKLSYISLLCKNPDQPELCKNYRPISLLNVDYKILTKVLCNRLSASLAGIVHPDQTCSVPGRTIFDNCHLIRDVINDVNSNPLDSGILLSTDQEKAFDRVDHSYMLLVLKHFGFSDDFIRWISIIYNDISSAVIVNNHVSTTFPVKRSVRQGCPLSPLIYVLCLEPLLKAIRNDENIKGIHVAGWKEPCKLSAFADDCKFLLKNTRSVERVLAHFESFGTFSGAKLSKSKTEVMYLGKWRLLKEFPLRINLVKQIKIFGIIFGDASLDDIWHPIFVKAEKVLNLFKTRQLSVYGKAKLINSMVFSKLWYVATIVPLNSHYSKLLTRLVFQFIWGKIESVKRDTMYLPCKEGGINLVNISLKSSGLDVEANCPCFHA